MDFDCGCGTRKEVMFTEGKLGKIELAFMTTVVVGLYLGWKLG